MEADTTTTTEENANGEIEDSHPQGEAMAEPEDPHPHEEADDPHREIEDPHEKIEHRKSALKRPPRDRK